MNLMSPQGQHVELDAGQANVRRRIVFYLPGYDPISPRRYRELYRSEGAIQAEISGYSLSVAAGPSGYGTYGWTASYRDAGTRSQARVEFLQWNDIVQKSMQFGIVTTYLKMFGTLGYYIRTGALLALFRLRPQPMIAALYPVIMLSSQLGLAALAGRFLRQFLHNQLALPLPLALLAGLALLYWILTLFRRNDGPLYAYYLALDFIFSASNGGRLPAPLAGRLAMFADRVSQAMQQEHDEVLIVGHSTGAHLAVELAASVLRRSGPDARLSLLTLGQVIPMVSFLPDAGQLRRSLHELSCDDRLTWVDVSAPGDGACFALSDPVCVSGVSAPDGGKLWPRVISAAFAETLSAETYRSLRWRFFRLHVQYLSAFDFPRGYDYFAITAGPQTLFQRFGHRGSSASTDCRPLSPHSGM